METAEGGNGELGVEMKEMEGESERDKGGDGGGRGEGDIGREME